MIHCTDSADAILDSDVYFVTLDEKRNVCYTLNDPNKLSKIYAAIDDDPKYNQVNFILLSVRKMHTEV